MNDQQFTGLVLACAIVMVPLGIALALCYRQWRAWLAARLPPRYLKPMPEWRRRSGGGGA